MTKTSYVITNNCLCVELCVLSIPTILQEKYDNIFAYKDRQHITKLQY